MLVRILILSASVLVGLATSAAACVDMYVVKHGDTLSEIARKELGSVFGYNEIYKLNQDVIGENPHRISIGMELQLPCVSGDEIAIDWSVMPDPASLPSLMRQTRIQIVDIRSAKAVEGGVIPGSIWIPYKDWRGPKDNPGAPPSVETLSRVLGDAGLRVDQPIVIIHNKPTAMDTGRAAYVYWLLKSVGADQLAILRGGYAGWTRAGLYTFAGPLKQSPYTAELELSWDWRADSLDIYGIATDQVDGHLLDARPHNVFSRLNKLGEALETTLPGARNAPVTALMTTLSGEIDVKDGVDDVLAYFEANNAYPSRGPIVSFCTSGELGALNWFYASELAGMNNVRLYPESVKGWAHDGGKLVAGPPSDAS